MENIKKNNLIQKIFLVIKYLIYFLVLYLLMHAHIANIKMIFAAGFAFSLLWCNQKPYIIALLYLFASMLCGIDIANIINAVSCVFVMLFSYYMHMLAKRSMNVGLLFSYFALSQIAYFYQTFIGQWLTAYPYIVAISGIMFLFCAINFMQVLVSRGMLYKFTLDEIICLFVFMCAVGAGLSVFEYQWFSAYKFVALLGSLVLICVNKQYYALAFAIAIGLGAGLGLQMLEPIAIVTILMLSASIFRFPYRMFMVVATLIVDFVICYIFGINMCGLITTAFAGSILLSLPASSIERLSASWQVAMSEVATRNIVSSTRKSIRKRMQNLSNIFFEMEHLYKGLVKGNLTRDQVRDMLYNELVQTICTDCFDKPKCLRAGMQQQLEHLLDVGLDKGKVTILDMPDELSARCGRSNAIIGKINQIINQYSNFSALNSNIDNAKILLSETLGGVSKLILSLADEIDKNICYDTNKEAVIVDKLLVKNIICSEIVLYQQSDNKYYATLVIKGDNAYNPYIEKVVSKVCGCKMKISDVSPSEKTGWQITTLTKMSKYDMAFGLATAKKDGSVASGDSHSLLRLDNNRYLMALCDGMGSGGNAQSQSAMTIGLVENFYRAGFDNDMVLSSVNKLLSVNSQENYSTLDLGLVDLDLGNLDLIKVGSPFGIIRREDRIDVVEGGALPIGVLEHSSPKYYRTTITTADFVVLMTDGITDAFENADNFTDFIASVDTVNPQTLAEQILIEAIRRNQSVAKDDMTVLVARMYQKN